MISVLAILILPLFSHILSDNLNYVMVVSSWPFELSDPYILYLFLRFLEEVLVYACYHGIINITNFTLKIVEHHTYSHRCYSHCIYIAFKT